MEKIRQLRKENGMTQIQLSEALHVSKGAVAMWETGKRKPTYEYLRALSLQFNKSPEYILCYSDDPSPVPGLKQALSPEEIKNLTLALKEEDLRDLVFKYAQLDEYGQKAVYKLLEGEWFRCAEQDTRTELAGLEITVRVSAVSEAPESEEGKNTAEQNS